MQPAESGRGSFVSSCGLDAFLDPAAREQTVIACLDRIDAVEPEVRAFASDGYDRRRAERAIEEGIENGGPLAGVPIAVKEIAVVDGYSRRCGSNLPATAFSGDESSLVTRFRRLGAAPIGLTVSTEFAYFDPGPTRNPHDLGRTPGGSSSGSAAAVAAGMVPVAIGTQTIGSIIRPAAYCGIVGFKPSFGLLPRDGFLSFSRTVDHVGLFAQRVSAIQAVFDALGVVAAGVPVAEATAASRLVAVSGDYLAQADDGAVAAFRATIAQLRTRGFVIEEADPFGDIERINADHRLICAREFYHAHAGRLEQYSDLFRDASRDLARHGAETPLAAYDGALERREADLGRSLAADLDDPTVWLSPAAPGPAPVGLDRTGDPVMNLPWTYLGRPAVTVPAGPDVATGLPIGLQVSGPINADRLVLGVAGRLERSLRSPASGS